MNILQKIADVKRREIEALKKVIPADVIRELALAATRPVISMSESIRNHPVAIIAEHKRRSPSRGEIKPMSDVERIAGEYAVNGAAAMSVLTDTPFFGGSPADLAMAREAAPSLPLLRKEFIIDEYQIFQARVLGADAVLLIASLIPDYELEDLHHKSHLLGMQTLIEVHSKDEIASLPSDPDMVGVNNRNLASFNTDISNSARLADLLPGAVVKIAESGIKSPADIAGLMRIGFDGFLIGEAFMSTPYPGMTLSDFIQRAS